ncbi:RNA polymerase sigma factor [Leifsonia sp. YIM 134122]|uniref:RNA polymerase sigma factor n=1 Tax=Leifsonia stereocauli TaxID=3134136 RepID=A0ABU9W6E5_9MICO
MEPTTARAAVEAVWRLESTAIIATLVRVVRDVALAEDLAQDAVVAALDQWPRTGIPAKPAAWLMAVAKRRAMDAFRADARGDRVVARLAMDLEWASADDPTAAIDHVDDDVLRLMFICCHPVLTEEGRTTLTLRLVAGLTAREIARAYLTSEATIAQRISRAKRTLTEAGAAIEEPSEAERAERMGAVLRVVYLLFNEGYAATEGQDWMRPALCVEAIRVGRILTTVAPTESEAQGLLALMELQSSRLRARVDAAGRPVLLDDQDRSRWDSGSISRGSAALAEARRLAAGADGPYLLQARIAACHAHAESTDATDWALLAELYEQLARLTGSPVVELNRAVVLGRAVGPEAGLALVDQLVDHPALRGYHLLPAVRADLLQKLGRRAEAVEEYLRAAELATNLSERDFLRERAADAAAR